MKRIAWFSLFIFLSFTVLAGCAGPPIEADAKLGEPQKIEVAEERDEPAKNERLERERRIDQIRLSLVERGLISENHKTYGLGEEIDLSGRNNPILEGNKYYLLSSWMGHRVGHQVEKKYFSFGVNLFGEFKRAHVYPEFPLDDYYSFRILVGEELIRVEAVGINRQIRSDGKGNTRYNFKGTNAKIVEKFKEPTDAVLFFTIAGKTDIVILLEEDIDWDTS